MSPKIFFLRSARKLNFYVFLFVYHDCLQIYCLNYILDEFLEERTSFDFFFSNFILKMATLTYYLWKPTFAKKMLAINCYGFPLHGNFWQNLFSAKKLKIFVKCFEFFSKLHVQGSIIAYNL
jgi:hypothetical protein